MKMFERYGVGWCRVYQVSRYLIDVAGLVKKEPKGGGSLMAEIILNILAWIRHVRHPAVRIRFVVSIKVSVCHCMANIRWGVAPIPGEATLQALM